MKTVDTTLSYKKKDLYGGYFAVYGIISLKLILFRDE